MPRFLAVLILINSMIAQDAARVGAKPLAANSSPITEITGFRNPQRELELEKRFMAVPDPGLAQEHLRILTAAPHMAGTPEDKKTADYVAQKFRDAGLQTEIREYKVWMNTPAEISVDITSPRNVKMHGPTREHVDGDPFQDDPRVVPPFNVYSPSGDAEAEVVYANYGRPEDLKRLQEMKVDVKGKILLVRYGQNFRGVKAFVAHEYGAAGVLIYSDPIDDGYFRGDVYPKGPWRPATGVQRGSIQYGFQFSGDPTTPGFASLPDLPESKRVPPEQSGDMPRVLTTPLSYGDAAPILQNLAGTESPREWQGALPFTYHVGPGPVRVRIHLKQNYGYTTIWDVIGRIPGSETPEQWVVAGNHRDAWVYGAVDPNSGTAALLEAVHGMGELLRAGWKPKRTVVFGSWDAEEQGLIGSTEWAEDNERALAGAAAYFNMDTGASGPNFRASAIGTLKQFVGDVTKSVPSPQGGTVYDSWRAPREDESAPARPAAASGRGESPPSDQRTARRGTDRSADAAPSDVVVGNLGSGSDYTPFIQHLGVPATDVRSSGNYGVYHSVFDNFAWYMKFGDPTFVYTQEMARVYGLEVLRMANADIIPYDYENYGREIASYVEVAQRKLETAFPGRAIGTEAAAAAAQRLTAAGARVAAAQRNMASDAPALNRALLAAERALLLPGGLPNRPWFRHAIYAPGQYTGYAAVVIPGVTESIEKGDAQRTQQQIAALAAALNRAAELLERATP